jgi:site-specific recombinase XerD
METTDFAKHLSDYLSKYLPGERAASRNTILSYRDTFILLIGYMKTQKGIIAEKLYLENITKPVVVEFLNWLQDKRKSSNATRNYRMAAIHSFFSYLQYEMPEKINQWQEILSIKVKRIDKKSICYLTLDGIKLLLEQIDITNRQGRKDLALLSLMYDTGARVQEIIDLSPSALRLENPAIVKLFGKGRKERIVPLQNEQVKILMKYLAENKLDRPEYNASPLFPNNRGEKLTRSGVAYILNHYVENARKCNPELIPNQISPHTLRHSKAMHLLQAGVNLVYIRDLLGHVTIQTTEIYARADSKQKREALEKAYEDVIPEKYKTGSWEKDENLLMWLKNMDK